MKSLRVIASSLAVVLVLAALAAGAWLNLQHRSELDRCWAAISGAGTTGSGRPWAAVASPECAGASDAEVAQHLAEVDVHWARRNWENVTPSP